MKVKVSSVMAKVLNKSISSYKFVLEKMNNRQFELCVDCDGVFKHEEDYDFTTGNIKVIRVVYPADYYACDKYLTTNDLVEAFDNSDKSFDGFIKQVKQQVEI